VKRAAIPRLAAAAWIGTLVLLLATGIVVAVGNATLWLRQSDPVTNPERPSGTTEVS
jgi:hypothetical protein